MSSHCLRSPLMLTVAVFRAGTTDTLGDVLERKTVNVSRFSGMPSCMRSIVSQNCAPSPVPMGRLITTFTRGVKSAGAVEGEEGGGGGREGEGEGEGGGGREGEGGWRDEGREGGREGREVGREREKTVATCILPS